MFHPAATVTVMKDDYSVPLELFSVLASSNWANPQR